MALIPPDAGIRMRLPGDGPLHCFRDEMGDDQNQDGEQDLGSPQEQLVSPIGGGFGVLVHYVPLVLVL